MYYTQGDKDEIHLIYIQRTYSTRASSPTATTGNTGIVPREVAAKNCNSVCPSVSKTVEAANSYGAAGSLAGLKPVAGLDRMLDSIPFTRVRIPGILDNLAILIHADLGRRLSCSGSSNTSVTYTL